MIEVPNMTDMMQKFLSGKLVILIDRKSDDDDQIALAQRLIDEAYGENPPRFRNGRTILDFISDHSELFQLCIHYYTPMKRLLWEGVEAFGLQRGIEICPVDEFNAMANQDMSAEEGFEMVFQ